MKKLVPCLLIIVLVLMTSCSPSRSGPARPTEPEYWPTAGWRGSSPEAQGMDSGQLAELLDKLSANKTSIHSLLIVRNGYVVLDAYFHPYTAKTKIHFQSVTKSIIGMLVGKAIVEGHLESENQRLTSLFQDRVFENPDSAKDAILLKHLLSMSSGLECQEFSASGPSMEQSDEWVQFMLERPLTSAPGKAFGYCNGNAHLLSAILQKSTGLNARQYANQSLFRPLGIAEVSEADWGSDPQGITLGGYGLHLTPTDMAKLAYVYLNRGQWEDQQIVSPEWVAASTSEHVQKEDGSAYGYLWTVYPKSDHYAALGLGGQQVHVYPSRNLIVVTTASLESTAEAPEIENALNEYILPAVQAEHPLQEDAAGLSHLKAAVEAATNPVLPPGILPAAALDVSKHTYNFGENALGWENLQFVFEPGAAAAQILLNGIPVEVGLDNIYRLSDTLPGGEILLRGRWVDDMTFVLDYPYPLSGGTRLGELGDSEFRFKFTGDEVEVSVRQLVFGAQTYDFRGER